VANQQRARLVDNLDVIGHESIVCTLTYTYMLILSGLIFLHVGPGPQRELFSSYRPNSFLSLNQCCRSTE